MSKHLEAIEKESIEAFVLDCMLLESPHRVKLSVHINSREEGSHIANERKPPIISFAPSSSPCGSGSECDTYISQAIFSILKDMGIDNVSTQT